jgi:hypothetical protein
MRTSVQRATGNKVGRNSRQVSNAEHATQIVESSEIKGIFIQEVLSEKKDAVESILNEILASIENLGLNKAEKSNLEVQTKTAQEQMKAETPHPTIISACLGSISKTLNKIATAAAASSAGKVATILLDKIGAFVQ